MNIEELKLRAKEYVGLEAETKVKKVEYVDKFTFLGITDVVFSVSSDAGDFWVVGGSSPMNLYDKSKFDSADEAFSFHLGIMHRLKERDLLEEDEGVRKIKQLIEGGNKIAQTSDFSKYDTWKRKVQFFIEGIGSPSMVEEVNKEINRHFTYMTSTNSPSDDLDMQERRQQKSQLQNLLSILKAIKERFEFDSSSTKIEEDEDIGYDAFICHASEDKEGFVGPLAGKLVELGLNVWYDKFSLKIGDSLRRSIDKGLANSRYGIVVLSKNFFAKEWPQKELDGLTAKEIGGKKVILPIWHNVIKEDILKYSPPLADKVAADTSKENISQIAKKLKEVIKE